MTNSIMIVLCSLLLLAYVFDVSSSRTRIPSVVLLLATGFSLSLGTKYFGISMPNLLPVLKILGTIGLILIVLEGALELELEKQKLPLIRKAFFMALWPLVLVALLLSALVSYLFQVGFMLSLLNIVPICIISSAIAIPSVASAAREVREMVIYESSFSDILGVVMFNFILANQTLSWMGVAEFVWEAVLIVIISTTATIVLALLLKKIRHHIKYGPIILMIILIYGLCKIWHLPGLLFVLIFGIFIGNADELRRNPLIHKLSPETLNHEAMRLKELVGESAFVIRAFFFLLFGFLTTAQDIFEAATLGWALAFTTLIFVIRVLFLWLQKLPIVPLAFVAPRGLITILLFLSVPTSVTIPLMQRSLIIQVMLLCAMVMTAGNFLQKKTPGKPHQHPQTHGG